MTTSIITLNLVAYASKVACQSHESKSHVYQTLLDTNNAQAPVAP